MALRASLISKLALPKNMSRCLFQSKRCPRSLWAGLCAFPYRQQQVKITSLVCATDVAKRLKRLDSLDSASWATRRKTWIWYERLFTTPGWFAGELRSLVWFHDFHVKAHTDNSAHSNQKIIRTFCVSFCPPPNGVRRLEVPHMTTNLQVWTCLLYFRSHLSP